MSVEQTIAALRWTPLLPMAALIALGVICAVGITVAAVVRARGWPLRAAALAVLLLWLAGPRLVRETHDTLPDIAVIAVDQTASMRINDRSAIASAVAADLARQSAAIAGLETRTITVHDAGADGTLLFGAIGRALADVPRERLAGVVAITDGQAHDIPDAKEADAIGAPLHVLIPARGEETDRRIRIVEAPSFGIVGKSVTIRLVVDDLGVSGAPSGTARLTIRRDDEPPRDQDVAIGREATIELPVARAGPSVIALDVEQRPGEVSALNNRAVTSFTGVRDRLRVLLISGEPHPGERTWRRLLRADPAVDLVHFTILRPPERDDMTPLNELALIAFPVRELFQVKLREFDLVILDRYQNRGLLPTPYLRNIADYVRDGGALLVSAGPEFAGPGSLAAGPIGSVLPARPASVRAEVNGVFRPAVTPLGERHPVTAGLSPQPANGTSASAPWGEWYRRIEPADVSGETVMSSADGAPLLLLDRVGQGRSALLLSDQIWLWSRGHDGGGPQAELLRRLAHWLMSEPELEENALEAHAEAGRLTVVRRALDPGPSPELTLTDPDGVLTKHALTPSRTPGTETLDVAAERDGVWRVSDGTRTAFAAVGPANPKELADLRATATLIGPAARATGGSARFVGTANSGGAPRVTELRMVDADRRAEGENWIGLRRRHAHVVTGIASVPLVPTGAALPLLLGLVVLAWRREGT